MKQRLGFWRGAATTLCAALVLSVLDPTMALAFPGVFAGKDGGERISRSTQVVVMKNGGHSVVSVMTDYQGPMSTFMMVLPVPGDVKLMDVKVLKRADVERLEELTAPRFHEFWEMDPCDPGKHEQLWERSRKANANSDFLGGADMFKNTEKVAKEMKLKVVPTFREDGEYKLSLVAKDIAGWLSGKGYKLPSGAAEKLEKYSSGKFLVAEVDPRRVELGPKGEALLSPIRYSTKTEVKIASTLGLSHLKGKQELLVYVLHPKDRFEVANYKNVYPPTNIRVDFKVKERMADFYANLHDKLLAKDKEAFLVEYAWNSTGCGEPCPNAAIHLSELLTWGADMFEAELTDKTRNPEPAERTEEQEAIYKAADKAKKEHLDYLSTEVVRRRALIKRQGDYVVSRLHHRYGKDGLTKDIELKSASHIERGVDVPEGEEGVLPVGEKNSEKSRLQTRFYSLHPNKKVVECENPKAFRWGKPPRTYRGARRIWVADKLSMKNRKRTKAEEFVWTDIPALDMKSQAPSKKVVEAPKDEEKESGCSLTAGKSRSANGLYLFGLAAMLWVARRRR